MTKEKIDSLSTSELLGLIAEDVLNLKNDWEDDKALPALIHSSIDFNRMEESMRKMGWQLHLEGPTKFNNTWMVDFYKKVNNESICYVCQDTVLWVAVGKAALYTLHEITGN